MESLWLFFDLAMHCWQLWGVTIFLIIPLFLAWLDEKGGGR
jgi:hypothetical protein